MAKQPLTILRHAPALLLLAACAAQPHWQKDGADEPAVQRDLSACRQQAQARFGAPAGVGGSPLGPAFGPVDPSPADRAMREAQSVGACMRGKGYALRAADANPR